MAEKDSIPVDVVFDKLKKSSEDKVWLVTKIVLAFREKYGDEIFEILTKVGNEWGVRTAENVDKMIDDRQLDRQRRDGTQAE